MKYLSFSVALTVLFAYLSFVKAQDAGKDDIPKVADPRLVIERFAAAPDIVHPINMTFDSKGRLLVIESHTHFRPANYQGPKGDRIRILEDTKGTGKADRFTTFFEGTTATMEIASHPDGSIYLSTRNEIIRLRDTKGDGKADEQKRIVFLDTKGNYPHNGLSGLTFDSKGNLYFGMGENLGASYKLIGSDGTTLTGEGEGGNIFWCTADGKKLRRVATGFWNPFGVCTDIFGRIFAVDNDPDSMPPCRMVHVVEGGDYGYQFRYGRSGRHPFQAWYGQLPGTLPMMTGVGEAPCKILSYESDGLPPEYVGDLLVSSWADHRIERYAASDKGASVVAERKPFVQGGKDFRPVGIAVAPDGSLFVSDWVLSNYELHGKGAIWHVRVPEPAKEEPQAERMRRLPLGQRSYLEASARRLIAEGDEGRQSLRKQLESGNVRLRASALTALIDADDRKIDLGAIADKDPVVPMREMAVGALVARGEDASKYLDAQQPASVRMEAIGSLKDKAARAALLQLLTDSDPFLRQAAIRQISRLPDALKEIDLTALSDVKQRQGVLLAHRMAGHPDSSRIVAEALRDKDQEMRFLAAKWIADEKLVAYRPAIVEALKDPQLSIRLYYAYSTALARMDNQDVSESRMADFFATQLSDPKTSPALRTALLRLVPATHRKVTLEALTEMLAQENVDLQRETVRVLNEHPNGGRIAKLVEVARNPRYSEAIRAEALVGVADKPQENIESLLQFVSGDKATLRDEALRGLINTQLTAAHRTSLEDAGKRQPAAADLVARSLGQKFAKDRPPLSDTDAWLKRLDGPADAAAGRRVFFHPRLANCARCHRVDGRGTEIGPDLSNIGRVERRSILESILQPDNVVAPSYQVWVIGTSDGKVHTGMLMNTELDVYTYANEKGERFKLNTRDMVETKAVPKSIMPTGLPDLLTDQELRDLLAYLCSRK